MIKDTFIQKGFIKRLTLENSKKSLPGLFNLTRWFKEMLIRVNVPYYDACCDESNTAFPVHFNSTTGEFEYFNGTSYVETTGVLTPGAAQNTIVAGTGGAIPITNYLTIVDTDAGGDAFTLANGTSVGQQKKIRLGTDGGGDAVITPTNLFAGTTITLNDSGDYVLLQWNGTEWYTIENSGGAIA